MLTTWARCRRAGPQRRGAGLCAQSEDRVKLAHGGFEAKPRIGVGNHRLAEVVADEAVRLVAAAFELGACVR